MNAQTPKSGERFVIASDALAEGEFREAMIEQGDRAHWLVLTRRDGRPRCWLNICPHAGRSLNWAPDQFLKDPEGNLICAAHGAVFETDRGECVGGPCKGDQLSAVPVEERDGEIRLAQGRAEPGAASVE
jgi:nitrite reductase/ring-hydroxylating ferredoxin subunit